MGAKKGPSKRRRHGDGWEGAAKFPGSGTPEEIRKQLESILALSADWYWEQDENLRFTRFFGRTVAKSGFDSSALIGKTRWELHGVEVEPAERAAVQAKLDARQPFFDHEYSRASPDGTVRYFRSSGHPVFDADGRFRGYRGIVKEVTQSRRAEHLLALEHWVARCLAEAENASVALKTVIRVICETEGWECGQYWRRDDSGVLRFGEHWCVAGSRYETFVEKSRDVVFAPGVGLVGTVLQSGKPLWVADVTKDPRLLRSALVQEIGSHGAFVFPPVNLEGKIIGVLAFSSARIRQPDERLLQTVRVIAAQIGQFLERKRVEEEQRRFRAALDASADMVVLIDRKTMRFVDVNETACQLLGYTREELLGMGPHDVLPTSRKDLERAYDEFIADPSHVVGMSSYYRRKDGSTFPFESTRRVLRSGDSYIIAAISRDISARIASEAALRASEARFRSLTQLSSDLYWEQDEQFRFTSFGGTGSGRFNVQRATYVGKQRWDQNYINMTPDAWAEHKAVLEAHQPFFDLELCRINEAGEHMWVSISGEPVFDAAGVFKGYRGVGKDITARKLDEERIQYLANHDALTALPNRTRFSHTLGLALQSAQRHQRGFAVLFIDLDRFKVINDTLGHEAGDIVLKEMGTRLKDTVRSSDVVARLGGDEFVVLLQDVSETRLIETVARKILSTLVKPVYVGQRECRVSASIGICSYPSDAEDEQTLMKQADIAMYRAKEDGKNTYKFYSDETNVHSFERLALETSLRNALERGQFLLHFQAKVNLHTGHITGVEALVRWQHPELGVVPPAQFIPLAEETGLIVPLGRWVLRTACLQNVRWQDESLPHLRIAVNISARQFSDDGLLGDIERALKDTGMRPELLELEITESMVMHNPERAAQVLASIKRAGVRLALDDFGVGHSSLTHLKRFPLDTLKVDRSFIRDVPGDPDDRAITEAIIAMGRSLSLTVVAEGVETEEQAAFLRERACDEMQGFYFSRPLPARQFAELLRHHLQTAHP